MAPNRRTPVWLGLGLLCAMGVACPQTRADDQPAATARGVLRSVSEATLSIDTSLRIQQLPYQAGQSFSKGDLLIAFDCERLDAERQVADAEARGARATYDNAARLHAQGAAGALEVAVAKAQAEKAAAGLAVATARLKPCKQVAPFSGRVVDVMVHEYDTPAINAPLIKIVDTARIEVELIVPSTWLRWLKPDMPFKFKIDETGQDVAAEIARLGATVDPVSQTVKVTGRLTGQAAQSGTVIPGMSGTAVFAPTS